MLQARALEWVAIPFSNAWKWKVKVKSLSRVWLSATPWTAAHQAPPSMGFSRQEHWSGPYEMNRWLINIPSKKPRIKDNAGNLSTSEFHQVSHKMKQSNWVWRKAVQKWWKHQIIWNISISAILFNRLCLGCMLIAQNVYSTLAGQFISVVIVSKIITSIKIMKEAIY